jgi:L-asparaginase / beta-aspartyl-peptidase
LSEERSAPGGRARAPLILVHGGAGAARIDDRGYRDGLEAAAQAGYAAVESGDCVGAVVAAVSVMEDDPAFNAGYGSVLNSRGEVECDAAVMRGADQDFGAVVAVKGVQNPVLLARAVLDSPQVMLAADGAAAFAGRQGIACVDPAQLVTQDRFLHWSNWMAGGQPALPLTDALEGCDTVGAVALDSAGHLAAATSTGGISFAPPGRVGDSALPGCGFWADLDGAASATGDGERIARVQLCRLALEARVAGELAAETAIEVMEDRVGGFGGLVALLADGRWSAGCNTQAMGIAWRGADMLGAQVEIVSARSHG